MNLHRQEALQIGNIVKRSEISKKHFWLLAAVCACTLFPFLGETLFNTRGEPREAVVALSMLQDDVLADLDILHQWYEAGYINSDAATLSEAPSYRAAFVAQGWSLAANTWERRAS